MEDKLKKITIKLKEPVYFDIANETSISTVNLDDIPTVEISTLTSFEQMAGGILQPYENTINDKMPSSFALIAKNAAKIKDDYDKVNFVTSSINDQIRYMGSWQTINGKIYPRSMDIIAQSGYADCKEYSVILAAILRKLGFKAHVALALRSYEPYMNRYKLPGMHLFNHAIVYAQSKSGIKLWIDPTNFISDAKDIFFDVSNRFCLILDPSNARLEKSPESKIQEIDIKKTTTYQDQYTAYTNGITSFKNSAAYKGTGAEMRTSRELVINGYVDDFCYDADKSEDYHVDFPILNTRIAKNFEVRDKYKIASPILLTNLGDGIKSRSFIWLVDYNVFLDVTKDFKGIMYLGPKIQFKYRQVYKNIKADNLEKLSFSMSNKWFNYSRKFSYINQDVILEEYFKMLENYVDPQENITELMSIRNELSNNLSKNIFIKSSAGSKEEN